MQFIAECGIEYGLQFVTQFFLNPLDCLYTKKSKKSFQSYDSARNYLKYLEIITNISTFAPDIIISTEARI